MPRNKIPSKVFLRQELDYIIRIHHSALLEKKQKALDAVLIHITYFKENYEKYGKLKYIWEDTLAKIEEQIKIMEKWLSLKPTVIVI